MEDPMIKTSSIRSSVSIELPLVTDHKAISRQVIALWL